MSTTTHDAGASTAEYTGPAFTAHDLMYLKIAVMLAVLTGIEVALSYSSLHKASLALPLLALAAIKFIVVAGFFMHLKFDTPILRRLFIGGAVLAGFCYTAVLYLFGHFHGPIPWLIYGAFALFLLTTWVFRRVSPSAEGHGHEDHDHADHGHEDHADHTHGDHDHDAHGH